MRKKILTMLVAGRGHVTPKALNAMALIGRYVLKMDLDYGFHTGGTCDEEANELVAAGQLEVTMLGPDKLLRCGSVVPEVGSDQKEFVRCLSLAYKLADVTDELGDRQLIDLAAMVSGSTPVAEWAEPILEKLRND